MGKEVVLIADDFGLGAEINQTILRTHLQGALHGAALMMGQPGTAHAVDLARAHPSLQVGWHLHLCDSRPVTVETWPWGASAPRAGFAFGLLPAARRLMRREIAAQWELFRATGLPCRFVNCHHHLHTHPAVYHALTEVLAAGGFDGWIRLGRPRAFDPAPARRAAYALAERVFRRRRQLSPWRSADTLWGMDRTFRMEAGEVGRAIAALPDGFHEFLFHPRAGTCRDTACLLALKGTVPPSA